tara:strand:+ start:3943 stop:4497 length:555 start_codon:yes stop_codon:yes gene_type:complete
MKRRNKMTKDELLLKISNLNDDEDFNEIPSLADALFEYDEKAAIELLRRAEDAAVHLDNYVKISETISEHTSDYEWFGRVHYKGFEKISEDFADGEDNHGLWDSPEECAYNHMEDWYTPFFNEEDEKYKGFNKVLKPINKEALQFMEELCSSSEDYENFLGYLDDKNYGFPDDKEWIQRIENKC